MTKDLQGLDHERNEVWATFRDLELSGRRALI